MNLDKLVGPETAAPSGYDQVAIAGLTADSREVRPGWLFAALRGSKADGSRFVADAVAKGRRRDPRRGGDAQSTCRRTFRCSCRRSRAGRWR